MECKHLARKFTYINMRHRYNMQSLSARIGLYAGQHPILDLLNVKGAMSQRDIAEQLHMSAPNVTAAVKRMLKAGLIKKTSDENDLRVNNIDITDVGRKLSADFKKEMKTYDELLFKDFSDDEKEQLNGYLNRVIKNMDGDPDDAIAFFRLMEEIKKEDKQKEERQKQ